MMILSKNMKYYLKSTKQQKNDVIQFFYNHHDNRSKVIAKRFRLNTERVDHIILQHLELKMERISKRNYDDIEW